MKPEPGAEMKSDSGNDPGEFQRLIFGTKTLKREEIRNQTGFWRSEFYLFDEFLNKNPEYLLKNLYLTYDQVALMNILLKIP